MFCACYSYCIDSSNIGIAVSDDYSKCLQFYFPLQTVKVIYQKNGIYEINLCISYNLQRNKDYKSCMAYRMYRKSMLKVDLSKYHVIDLKNIQYNLWIPHACHLPKGICSNTNDNMCKLTNTKLVHNCIKNPHFFLTCFGNKWKPLHYISETYENWSNFVDSENIDMDIDNLTDSERDIEHENIVNNTQYKPKVKKRTQAKTTKNNIKRKKTKTMKKKVNKRNAKKKTPKRITGKKRNANEVCSELPLSKRHKKN